MKAGLDLGNGAVKIYADGKSASIPSLHTFTKPIGILNKAGQYTKPKCFSLIIGNRKLYFGRDVLNGKAISKLDAAKYDANYIAMMTSAVIYHWSQAHNINLSLLPQLQLTASMPPGLFRNKRLYNLAYNAYKKAFNKPLKINDITLSVKFQGLNQECVTYALSIANGKQTLIADLGYGTNDYALVNGHLITGGTKPAGLLHTYKDIDDLHPGSVNLSLLTTKSYPAELALYYNEVEIQIQTLLRQQRNSTDHIIFIGGGASLANAATRKILARLAPVVSFEDAFTNCKINAA